MKIFWSPSSNQKPPAFSCSSSSFPWHSTWTPENSSSKSSHCFNYSETAVTLNVFSIRFFIFSDFLCSINSNLSVYQKEYPDYMVVRAGKDIPLSDCILFLKSPSFCVSISPILSYSVMNEILLDKHDNSSTFAIILFLLLLPNRRNQEMAHTTEYFWHRLSTIIYS